MIHLKCTNPEGFEKYLTKGEVYQGIDCAPGNPKQYFVIVEGGPHYFNKDRFEEVANDGNAGNSR